MSLQQLKSVPVSGQTKLLLEGGMQLARRSDTDFVTHARSPDPWRLARQLGALAEFGLQGRPFKKAETFDVGTERRLVNAGANLLFGGDEVVEAFFNQLRILWSEGGLTLPSRAFPGLRRMLNRPSQADLRGWVLTRLDRYIASTASGPSEVAPRLKQIRSGASAKAVGRQLKMRPESVMGWFDEVGLTLSVGITLTGRHMIAVRNEHLAEAAALRVNWVDSTAARLLSGLPLSRLQALADAGLVEVRKGLWSRNGLANLVNSLPTVSDEAPPGALTIIEAMRLLVPIDQTVGFIQALQRQGLSVWSSPVPTQTFKTLRIERAAVGQLGWRSSDAAVLTLSEAAIALRIKSQVVYELVDAGLLQVHWGRAGRRACRLVSRQALAAFRNEFAPLALLADAKGIRSRDAFDWAEQAGIELVCGPRVDGRRQYFARISPRANTPITWPRSV